jgi:hypothetical protein
MKVVCINSKLLCDDEKGYNMDGYYKHGISSKSIKNTGLTLNKTYEAEQSPVILKYYLLKGDNGIYINRSKKRFIPLSVFRENRLAAILDFA